METESSRDEENHEQAAERYQREKDQEVSEQVVLAMRNATFTADLRQSMGDEWSHVMRHWKASQYEAYHYRDTYLRGDSTWRKAEPSPKLSSAEVKRQRAEYTRDWKETINQWSSDYHEMDASN